MLNVYSKNIFVRIAFTFLSVVLCVLIIFNAGIVDCFAVAGVDDILFWVIVAVLGSCGISFATLEQARTGADTYYNNCDTATQDLLKAKAEEISTVGIVGIAKLALHWWTSEWSKIIQAVVATFGTVSSVSVINDYTADFTFNLGDTVVFECGNTLANTTITTFNNLKIEWFGRDVSSDLIPAAYGNAYNYYLENRPPFGGLYAYSVGPLTFFGSELVHNGQVYSSTAISYTNFNNSNSLLFGSFNIEQLLGFGNLILNNTPIQFHHNYNSVTGYSAWFTDSAGNNLISNGFFAENGLAVSESICPNGIFKSYEDLSNWVYDLIMQPSVTGNPSIDGVVYPGNDTWHDGSINDNVDTESPTIGIAVPLDDSLTTDYTSDKARDIANADTNIKPDNTGKLPPGLPPMTLPEILFKTKFPFSLPWDLYCLFVGLYAEPVAPKFDIPFKFERLGIDYTITIDISEYEEFANLSRMSLSVIFVIALILLSRKLIGA
ncbi:MAG: hypothetical protein UH241_04435 [Acutalibacteraceae bacterium]|nr:hypothetical protein [Acutalibacteraceae bacterium]